MTNETSTKTTANTFEVFNSFGNDFDYMDRGAAWHKLGKTVKNAETWQETMIEAGLDWKVSKKPLRSPDGHKLNGVYGMFREGGDILTDEQGFLGAVGEKFTAVQNERAFQFVDRLIESNPKARYEAAGFTGRGERVFCLANIGEGFDVVDGDHHENYLLFSNAHNTDSAPKVSLVTLRLTCSNQIVSTMRQAANGKLGNKVITFRHTASINDRLADAERIMQTAGVNAQNLQAKLKELSARMLDAALLEKIVNAIYPQPKPLANGEPNNRSVSRRQTKVDAFLELFEHNDNDAFPRLRGTAMNAVNAFTEYTDHFKPVHKTTVKDGWSEDEIRSSRSIFEDGVKEKGEALELILETTAAAPRWSPNAVAFNFPKTVTVDQEKREIDSKALLDDILDAGIIGD